MGQLPTHLPSVQSSCLLGQFSPISFCRQFPLEPDTVESIVNLPAIQVAQVGQLDQPDLRTLFYRVLRVDPEVQLVPENKKDMQKLLK